MKEADAGARPDVAAMEMMTRALIGIALEAVSHAEHSVTLPQFRLLLALDDLGRVPSSTLAARLRLAGSAVTRMVDRLERVGLVSRGSDPRSRRLVTVEVTPAGRRIVSTALAGRQARLATILDLMSPAGRTGTVQSAHEFVRLSGDAVALGAAGPVPL